MEKAKIHIAPEEIELVKQLVNGNQQALEKIFFKYAQALINFSKRFVLDLDTAENIVQDIFTKVWILRKNLNPDQGIKSYLFQAVRNDSLKVLRKVKTEEIHQDTIAENYTSSPSIETDFEGQEIVDIVYKAVDELPEKCKEIFRLNRYDGFKYKEIAEILNISPKTVENQMGIALKKIREKLKHLLITFLIFLFVYMGVNII